jgi:hypothetical protein
MRDGQRTLDLLAGAELHEELAGAVLGGVVGEHATLLQRVALRQLLPQLPPNANYALHVGVRLACTTGIMSLHAFGHALER